MVLAPLQGQDDLCSPLSNTEHFFLCPSPLGSMAPPFNSASPEEELQPVGNISRGCGLTRSLVAQCSATSFWLELQWI